MSLDHGTWQVWRREGSVQSGGLHGQCPCSSVHPWGHTDELNTLTPCASRTGAMSRNGFHEMTKSFWGKKQGKVSPEGGMPGACLPSLDKEQGGSCGLNGGP